MSDRSSGRKPGQMANRTKKGMKDQAERTERGVDRMADEMKREMDRMGSGMKRGARAAEDEIEESGAKRKDKLAR
ncbi:hypothetical protein [Nocardia thraciensis]